MGLTKGLIEKPREKVRQASKIARAVIACVKALHGAGLTWITENPEMSLLWFVQYFANIAGDPTVSLVKADQCRFGRPWKNRTHFTCGNIDDDDLGRLSKTLRHQRRLSPH